MHHLSLTRQIVAAIVVITGLLVSHLHAAPSLWGHGHPYIVALEDNAAIYTTRYALVAYDTPPRAKSDGEFLSRFIWQDAALANVLPGGLAVGDFWPPTSASGAGQEYLAMARRYGNAISVEVYRAPGVYGTRAWGLQSSTLLVGNAPANGSNDVVCIAAGNVTAAYGGSELLVVQSLSDNYAAQPRAQLLVYSRPGTPQETNWVLRSVVSSPTLFPAGARVIGMTAGDYTYAGRDWLSLLYQQNGSNVVRHFDLSALPTVTARGEDTRTFATAQPFCVAAADFLKEYKLVGRDQLVTIERDGVLVAPRVFSNAFVGAPTSQLIIDGSFNEGHSAYTNAPRAVAAGRIFGYLLYRYEYNSQPREPNQAAGVKDPGIAWIERWPLYSKKTSHGSFSTHYGWPLPGEAIWNNVVLENTGTAPSAPGTLRLSAWFNTPYRNADTHPAAMGRPDTQLVVNVALPTFQTAIATQYATTIALTYHTNWPYQFDNFTPLKRLVLTQELWNVVRLDALGGTDDDICERNNREEMAVHTWTLHPVFYPKNALSNNANPNVTGDPHSYMYLARKLCNAIQTFWERSGTTSNEDIRIRVNLMGYELDDVDNVHRSWVFNGTNVWDYWEGCRGLDFNTSISPQGYPRGVWFGHGQWQRMWLDAEGCEGHETTHLFHQMGDLYQYQVYPNYGAGALLADGRPLQVRTWNASPDVFSSDARQKFCKGTCDIHKNSVGMRNLGQNNWASISPETNMVCVRTRSGAPVAGASVKAYLYAGNTTAFVSAGTSLADGLVDIQYPRRPFSRSKDNLYGYWHYNDVSGGKTIFVTIDLPGYSDGWVWRQNDREYMHSSTIATASRAMLNPALDIWNVPTLYEPSAPAYSRDAVIVVEGSQVRISTGAQAGNIYRVYRRTFPTYAFELATQATASSDTLVLAPSLGGQTRAVLYLTEESGGVESNPRIFQISAIGGAVGITARDNETLLLALNAGTADPIAAVCRGSEPFAEIGTHWFFGHRPIKIYQPSDGTRLLMTISSYSEWGIPPTYVSWCNKYSEFSYDVFDVKGNAAGGWGTFDTSPQQILSDNANNFIGKHVQIGDEVAVGDARTNIIEVISATQLRLAGTVKPGGGSGVGYQLSRTMGQPGNGTTNRQLSTTVRGLGRVYAPDGTPHIAIADMGNNRVVVWDEWTRYVAHYQAANFYPTDVDADPLATNAFFAISRATDKKLWRFIFDGATVTTDRVWNVSVLGADGLNSSRQCGLAVVRGRNDSRLIAISDLQNRRVLVYELATNGAFVLRHTITAPLPPYIAATLQGPTDVEFLHDATRGLAQLYAADGGTRVVKLLADILTDAIAPFVDVTNTPAIVPYTTSSYTIGGTNGGQVVGMMCWSNTLTGINDFFPAAHAWQVTNISLGVGANLITVTGTNILGARALDSVTITRMDAAAGVPFVDVLTTNASVPYAVSSAVINGTNNTFVVGDMWWENQLSGDVGTLPATPTWTISNVFLTIGDNQIVVRGSNTYGMLAMDAVTITRTTLVASNSEIEVAWTNVVAPTASRGGVKLGSDGQFLYYLPGNNAAPAFYRYDPRSNLWTTLAPHPGHANQDANDNATGLEYRDGFLFAILRHATMTDQWGSTFGLFRYNIAANTWNELHSNIYAQGTLYAPVSTNVLYTNAGAWNNCLVTLGFIDTVCTSIVGNSDHSFLGDTHRHFNCQNCGTQGNWTKRFDTHCAAFDDYVYGVKQDWIAGTNASEGDVLWRAPKNDIRTGSAVAVTNLPWNPGTGLCCVSVPAARALTKRNEIVVVRGQGINANQDGWGSNTPDISAFNVATGVWLPITPLPVPTGAGTDIAEVEGAVYVKTQNSTALYRGTPIGVDADTQPPDIAPTALVAPVAGAQLATGMPTLVRWRATHITDDYDGTNCIITSIDVLRSNDAAHVDHVGAFILVPVQSLSWTPPESLYSETNRYVLQFTVRDLSGNTTSAVFWSQAFGVSAPDLAPPIIGADALAFPTAFSELQSEISTVIVWRTASVTDAVDGVHCTMSRIAIVRSNDAAQVALVGTNLPNTSGMISWTPAAELQDIDALYAVMLEAQDAAGNIAARTFWEQPFTVVPEPAVLSAIVAILLRLCYNSCGLRRLQ